jgi:hypothetical protein
MEKMGGGFFFFFFFLKKKIAFANGSTTRRCGFKKQNNKIPNLTFRLENYSLHPYTDKIGATSDTNR